MLAEMFAVLSGLLGFVLFFNRNPKRRVPPGRDILVSPADGRIKKTFKICSLGAVFKIKSAAARALDRQGPLIGIPITLSLLDVHVTKAPCAAKVLDIVPQKGKFIPAIFRKSLIHNQRNVIIMRHRRSHLAVVQSVGIFARRLRCWIKPGAMVAKGQAIGRILLGSGTMLIVPERKFKCIVKPKVHVKGGESILGVLR
jgi:phosphatidylserine decarboxylase